MQRILADRTRLLAARGVASVETTLPPHLVCLAGEQHVALPVGTVSSVWPFGCFPVPLVCGRAVGIMLGLATIGGRLASVLDLGPLLGLERMPAGAQDGPVAADGGAMLLLRAIEPAVAVRVDKVLGVLPLLPAADAGRALVPGSGGADGLLALAILVDPVLLAAAIAALDHA